MWKKQNRGKKSEELAEKSRSKDCTKTEKLKEKQKEQIKKIKTMIKKRKAKAY